MKKILYILLAMSLLLNGTIALAENAGVVEAETETEEAAADEIPSLRWEDTEYVVDLLGAEGGFYRYDDYNFRLWVPDVLEQVTLTEEQIEKGWLDVYSDESETYGIVVEYSQVGENMDFESFKAFVDSQVEGSVVQNLNDFTALVYKQSEDVISVAIEGGEPGYFLTITYNGMANQAFMNLAGISIASIMSLEYQE